LPATVSAWWAGAAVCFGQLDSLFALLSVVAHGLQEGPVLCTVLVHKAGLTLALDEGSVVECIAVAGNTSFRPRIRCHQAIRALCALRRALSGELAR
jgi:hypothetical protein